MNTLAYLDAGTGSMIVGAVAAGWAGVTVAGKAAFRRRFRAKGDEEVDAPDLATQMEQPHDVAPGPVEG